MIGVGSSLRITRDGDYRRVEDISVGDEVYDLVSGSLIEVVDINVRTIIPQHDDISEQISFYCSSTGGSRVEVPTKGVFSGDQKIVHSEFTYLRKSSSCQSHFSPLVESEVVAYKFMFPRSILMDVSGVICLGEASEPSLRATHLDEAYNRLLASVSDFGEPTIATEAPKMSPEDYISGGSEQYAHME